LILFAILDFGFLMFSRITLINATREGAHWAVVQADNAAAIDELLESPAGPIRGSGTGLTQADLSITVTCVPPSGSCEFADDGTGDGVRLAQSGDSVRVVANYCYTSFFNRFVPLATCNAAQKVPLQASVTMVLE
jgi:hypothetical protein